MVTEQHVLIVALGVCVFWFFGMVAICIQGGRNDGE